MLRHVTCRLLSTAAARPSAAVPAAEATGANIRERLNIEEPVPLNRNLCLFPSPKVVVPSFELTRRLGTLISQTIYQLVYERAYTKEGLVRAAIEGVSVLGECIANEEWDRMSYVASKDLVEQTKIARQRCTEEQLTLLRFNPDDAILSFIHSSFLSGRDFNNRKAEHGVISIYFNIASFIRKNDLVPWEATLPQLLNKYKSDVIVSNVTFARNVSPLGRWKATGLNFFELDEVSGRQ
ncbi:hypothetical protein Aduo_013986 [Ancylostoma duodenale]